MIYSNYLLYSLKQNLPPQDDIVSNSYVTSVNV